MKTILTLTLTIALLVPTFAGSKKERGLKGAAVGAGAGAAVVIVSTPEGRKLSGKQVGIGAAVGAGTGLLVGLLSGEPEQRQPRRREEPERTPVPRDPAPQPPSAPPSLQGLRVAIKTNGGGYYYGNTEQIIANLAAVQFDRMGALIVRQQGSSGGWGGWADSCVVPGQRIICVEFGYAQPVSYSSRSGSTRVDIPRAPTSGSGSSRTQNYSVPLMVNLYINSPADQYGKSSVEIIQLAGVQGVGNAESEYRNSDTQLGDRVSVSESSSRHDYPSLAATAAARDALNKLRDGRYWFSSAPRILAEARN